jgi:hypothetical protein
MRSLIAGCGVVMLAACGGGGGAASSPKALVEAGIAAINDGDAKALIALTAPPPRLLAALTCAKRPSIVDQLGVRVSFLEQRPDVVQGVHVELLSFEVVATRQVAKGDSFHDCTATEAFEVATYRAHQKSSDDATHKRVEQDEEAIRLDGRWYFL